MAQVCIAMLTGYTLKVPKIQTPSCKRAEVIVMVSVLEEFHCSLKSVALELVFWEVSNSSQFSGPTLAS